MNLRGVASCCSLGDNCSTGSQWLQDVFDTHPLSLWFLATLSSEPVFISKLAEASVPSLSAWYHLFVVLTPVLLTCSLARHGTYHTSTTPIGLTLVFQRLMCFSISSML